MLRRWPGGVAAVLMTCTVGILSAQEPTDSVTFSSYAPRQFDYWKPIATVSLSGRIVEFDAEFLVLVDAEGKQKKYPARQVVDLDFEWATPQAAAAVELFENQEYAKAIKTLVPDKNGRSAQDGCPNWQKRQLFGKLVSAIEIVLGPQTAGNNFLSLAKAGPPAMLYGNMPLCWTTQQPDRKHRDAAVEWLSSDDEDAQLLGASWLLGGAQRAQAKQVLQKLKASKNTSIASLATAQSWRLVAPPETAKRLVGWFEFRDKLIEPLQIGPTEFLADRLRQIGKPELALGEWMRIATLYPHRYHRFSAAVKRAETLLKQLQDDDAAQRLEAWKLAQTPQ